MPRGSASSHHEQTHFSNCTDRPVTRLSCFNEAEPRVSGFPGGAWEPANGLVPRLRLGASDLLQFLDADVAEFDGIAVPGKTKMAGCPIFARMRRIGHVLGHFAEIGVQNDGPV